MITKPVKGHIQSDGTLSVQVATGLPESEVEVVVIVSRINAGGLNIGPAIYRSCFETFGCISPEDLLRPPQGEYEQREELP